MMINKRVFKNIENLKKHIRTHEPSFYISSQTSTVIPYDKIQKVLSPETDYSICDLSLMPKQMKILENGNLFVEGSVSWKDASEFLKPQGLNINTAPTAELALITAGAATSATGERCFHFGNLRSQLKKIYYLDSNGEEKELDSNKKMAILSETHEKYNQDFNQYKEFKNAPFPRFEFETDLLIGTEGQLGVITGVELEVTKNHPVNHLFMLVPKWEDNPDAHFEIIKKIQAFREKVILCELIDENAFSFLPEEDRPNKGQDAIFFEVISEYFDDFYENFIMGLEFVNEDEIFELSETRFHNLRASIPRAVFEENSKMGVTKMGTDVQVKIEDFPKLLEIYKFFSKINVRYNLFGHFGDAHLHFNFMPKTTDVKTCQEEFNRLYREVKELNGSPFAEHGIGIIKQKFIGEFWTENQTTFFKELKKEHDPYNQFFPQGFMNLVVIK